ncbi:MAG: type II toxin-antitoxin system RelE/ParE family toxin [Bdellovibrionales bacterium]
MKTIQYSKDADEDLLRIFHYTRTHHGLKQAKAYTSEIKRTVEIFTTFPLIGQKYDSILDKNYRRFNIGQHTVFYSCDDDVINVHRVLHNRMDFDAYLD